jgi:hypothetical protein
VARRVPSATVSYRVQAGKVQTKSCSRAADATPGFANGPGGAPVDQQTRLCSPAISGVIREHWPTPLR